MTALSALRAGDRVDRFEVVAPLKRGGMGAVYAAVDRATGERVALKVMLADDPASADRFEREGRIAARLDHPHVVACRAFGRDVDGRAWMAMELLRGEDLEARLARAPPAPAEAVALAMQVCEALAHAHARGVVHRDLKPGNVFLCEAPAPHARVLDFGVARLEADPRLTRTGSPVGTPSYMSPEQARGERDVDARADLWSLGVVLYECLAGRPPFQAGSVVGTLYQIVSADPPDLARLRPDLPRALTEAVRRAMSRPRGERFDSAAAMRAALAAVDLAARPAAPPALAATRADPTPAEVTATRASVGGDGERRLVAAVCLDGVRDPVFVEGVARALQGHVEPLARGAALVLFGAERWAGDEPRRALRFARAAAPACRAVGVATGRVIRGTLGGAFGVAGEAVDAAAALARADGLHVDPATAALDEAADAPAHTPPGAAPRGPFVGRSPELALLARSVADAAEALALRPVVVVGAAGLGKTHLCREALARAAAVAPGLRALVVRGEVLHRDAPFLALREALARAVDPGVAALLDPAPEAPGDPVAALDRARASLRTALEGLCADGPLVVAVDDVQWLDLSSRAALRWLREQEPDLPIALWVFGRTEARDAAADLAGAAALELAPLDRADAEALLRGLCGDAPEALLERAGGHPLFLESLGRLRERRGALAPGDTTPLPLSVEGAHLAWLDQLAPAERELARRAAVFGRHWWLEGAERLGGEASAVAGLRRAGVASPRARGRFPAAREFAFRTGLLAEVAYGLLPEALRPRLHARAAAWLDAQPGAAPDELARHWELGEEPSHAAERWAEAAATAAAVADAPTACAHAARALALAADPALRWRVLASRDDALQVAGDAALQGAGLDELDALAPALGLAHETEAAWRRCYFQRLANDDVDRAVATGRRAAELAARLGAPRWGARANIELALLLADAGHADEASARAEEAGALAARAGEPWLLARADAARAYVGLGDDPAAALARFESAAEGFARAGDRRREALMHNNAAAVLMRLGRVAEAAARFESALEASRRVGNAQTAAVAAHNLGVTRRLAGDLAGARAAQEHCRAEAARLGFARLAAFVAAERAWVALAANDDAPLAALAAEAVAAAEAARAPALAASARAVSLRVAARLGALADVDLDAARALAEASPADARLELALAVWAAGGETARDADAAHAAFAAHVARVADPDDRAACAASLARRYLVPPTLLAGGAGGGTVGPHGAKE